MRLPSELEFRILALVSEERTEREVAQCYKAMSGKLISHGAIHTTFGRMKDMGWVAVREDGNADPDQRWYTITRMGKLAAELTARRYVVAITDCAKMLGRGISAYFDRMNTPAFRRYLAQLKGA
jgi:DNA-binding PadR family transcriptional regulator